MDSIFVIITLFFIALTSLYWGRKLSIVLPEFDWRFDRKPFNCRPCLTFHIQWVLSVLCALLSKSAVLAIGGVIVAFFVFLIVWYIDNKKIIK